MVLYCKTIFKIMSGRFAGLESSDEEEEHNEVVEETREEEEVQFTEQSEYNEEEWTTVLTSPTLKKKYIANLKDALYKNASNDEEVLSNVVARGQFVASADMDQVVDVETGPKVLKVREPDFKIKKTRPAAYPLEKFGKFSMTPYESMTGDVQYDIILTRSLLRNILRCFDETTDPYYLNDFCYSIKVLNGKQIYIQDENEFDLSPAYGYGFEKEMTTARSEIGTHFFRRMTYNLGGLNVLLCSEVDCVDESENSIELKSYNDAYDPTLIEYWYQMVLANVKHLVLGARDSKGNMKEIKHLDVSDIAPQNSNFRLHQLSMLLKWIFDTMLQHPNSEEAKFEYKKCDRSQFTLTVTIPKIA